MALLGARLRSARLLAWPTARTIGWPALLAAAAVGFGLLVAGRLGLAEAAPLAHWPGMAGLALCLGAAWLFDDPSTATVASTPTPLALRRLVRLALVLPVLGSVWALELRFSTGGSALFGPGARGALSLEFAAMLAATLAAAALALHAQPEGRGSWAGIGTVFGLLALATVLPARFTLLALPGDGAWAASHLRWAAILAAGVLVLAWTSRESRPFS